MNKKFLTLCAVTAVMALSQSPASAFEMPGLGGFNPMNVISGVRNQNQQNQQPQVRQNPQYQQNQTYNGGDVVEETTVRKVNGRVVQTTTKTVVPDQRVNVVNPSQQRQPQPNYQNYPNQQRQQPAMTQTSGTEQPGNGRKFLNAGEDMVKATGGIIGSAATGVADTGKSLFDKIKNNRVDPSTEQYKRDPNMMP